MAKNPSPPPVIDQTVEMDVTRLRVAIGPGPSGGYVPRMCLWIDAASGMIIHFELAEPASDYTPLALQSLGQVAQRLGGIPREIRLRDVDLAAGLRRALEPLGVAVVVREDLPMLDEAINSMADFRGLTGDPQPTILDVPGMTLDHLHAFADAAQLFYAERPWRHLSDADLIAVESPAGPPGTQFTQVLGAGGQTFGLGFVPSRRVHESMQSGGGLPRGGLWTLQFGDIDHLPFDDGELWTHHNLPVAGPRAYPNFGHFSRSRGFEHPTPDQLVWAEGLLRAIAATTEDQLDAGRWEQIVTTFAGPATYRFSMPLLLEQMAGKPVPRPQFDMVSAQARMEQAMRAIGQQIQAKGGLTDADMGKLFTFDASAPEFVPTNDAERAEALCYQARQARGRREIQLARQALALDPQCSDALMVLALRAGGPHDALPLYRRAVEAAQRRLGPETFEKEAGNFWGILETRPYMRARRDLALTLASLGKFEEAAEHFRELIRLNPGDNQGNRYHLAQTLLLTDQLDELDGLLNRAYPGDDSAEWGFNRALLEFRRHGDSPQARQQLARAAAQNPHVVPFLTGRRPMPTHLPPTYQPGSEDEAVLAVDQIADAWEQTPEALEWLEDAAPKTRRPRAAKGKSKAPSKSAGKKRKPR